MRRFVKTDDGHLVHRDSLVSVDYSRIEDLHLTLVDSMGVTYFVTGIHALEAAMLLRPDVVEGKRLRWSRHAWLVHNLIGHPLLQIAALAKCYRIGFWFHDITVPKSKGKRTKE